MGRFRPIAVRLRIKLEVAWMKHSEIQESHAQHGTFLFGALFVGLPGLRAAHFIQATFDTNLMARLNGLIVLRQTTQPRFSPLSY